MFNKSISVIILMMVFPLVLCAQISEQEIKLSGNYQWGEGFAMDRDEAINNAKRDLIERILVTIVSEAELDVEENDEEVSSAFQSKTSSLSRMELRGLDYRANKKRDNSWQAVAYVSKKDFENTIQVESQRLLTKLEQGLKLEESEEYNKALAIYYDLFTSTYFIPVPVYTDVERHGSKTELRQFLRSRINDWLNAIEVSVEKVRSLSTENTIELYIDLELSYNGESVNNLSISVDKPGYGEHKVLNGKTSVFIDWAPEKIIGTQVFNLKPTPPPSVDEELHSFADRVIPTRQLSIPINYSDVIRLDFDISTHNGSTFQIEPRLKNLTVFDLKWEFGNGDETSESSPRKKFGDLKEPREITLTINQSEALSVTKILKPDGTLAAITTSKNKGKSSANTATNNIETKTAKAPRLNKAHSRLMNEIIRIKDGQRLATFMSSLYRKGDIVFGTRSDVADPDKSYIAIINPDTRQVFAILQPVDGDERYNLTSNSSVKNDNLADEFRGYGSIWFQFK